MVGFLFHYRDILPDMAGSTPIAMYIGFEAPNGAAVWQALADAADATRVSASVAELRLGTRRAVPRQLVEIDRKAIEPEAVASEN